MEILEVKNDKALVVKIKGRLDASTAPVLDKKFLELVESGEKNYLINMGEMDYISSVGLRVLLVLAKKAKAMAGRVVLCQLQEQVYEVFEISGFTTIFSVFQDEGEALADF